MLNNPRVGRPAMRNLRVFLLLVPILTCALAWELIFPTRECLIKRITSAPACVEYYRWLAKVPRRYGKSFSATDRRGCLGENGSCRKTGAVKFRMPDSVSGDYKTYQDMVNYMKKIKSVKHPKTQKPLAEVEVIGKTYEKRDMHLVKISSDHSANKPVIFFEAGMHGREWSAPAAALYMISELVENYTANQKVLEQIDFYIVPLSNPDGYEYSRTKDRYWRKTRSRFGKYYGVDGNRNFNVHWADVPEKTNNYPWSEIFKGPWPFSEPEARNIRDAGIKYKDRINAFISIHAFGAMIGYAWGFSRDITPPLQKHMKMVAMEAAKAIKDYSGTNYIYGSTSELIYASAGGSDDYFKEALGVELVFTFELSSSGLEDFVVPPSKLLNIAKEAFEGFKEVARYAATFDPARACFGLRKAPYKDLIC